MHILPRSDRGRWLVILFFGLVMAVLVNYTNRRNEERYRQWWAQKAGENCFTPEQLPSKPHP